MKAQLKILGTVVCACLAASPAFSSSRSSGASVAPGHKPVSAKPAVPTETALVIDSMQLGDQNMEFGDVTKPEPTTSGVIPIPPATTPPVVTTVVSDPPPVVPPVVVSDPVPTGLANEDIVLDAYTSILGRTRADALADTAGRAYWVGRLNSREISQSQFRKSLRDSDEYFVHQAYMNILKRDPSMAEVSWYVAELKARRTTRTQISAHFEHVYRNGLD